MVVTGLSKVSVASGRLPRFFVRRAKLESLSQGDDLRDHKNRPNDNIFEERKTTEKNPSSSCRIISYGIYMKYTLGRTCVELITSCRRKNGSL